MIQYVRENLQIIALGFKSRYSGIMFVYSFYGILSVLTQVPQIFWYKNNLSLTATELIELGIWGMLPWTLKIAFSQFIENIPIFGNSRKSYIVVGSIVFAIGNLFLALVAENILFWSIYHQLLVANFLIQAGLVIQDIVADTLCAELVEHKLPSEQRKKELAAIQITGRMCTVIFTFFTVGLSSYLGNKLPFKQIVYFEIILGLITILSIFFIKEPTIERQKPNLRIIIPAFAIALLSLFFELSGFKFTQEILIFVNFLFLYIIFKNFYKDFDHHTIYKLKVLAIVIFSYKATPELGQAINWWQIDILGFDQQFFANLRQTSYLLAFFITMFLSHFIVKQDIIKVILYMTLFKTIIFIPYIAMSFGFHDWTMEHFGFGARTIAIGEILRDRPSTTVIMAAIFTIASFLAPKDNKPTWFALIACFLNLGHMFSILSGKWLNQLFVIERGQYQEVSALLISNFALCLALPLITTFYFLKNKNRI